MNTEQQNVKLEEVELDRVELLEEFQMEELEQRFEMKAKWFDNGPQTPGSSQGTLTIPI